MTDNNREKDVDALCPECGNAFKLFVDRLVDDREESDLKIKEPCPVCGCGECRIGHESI